MLASGVEAGSIARRREELYFLYRDDRQRR